MITASQYDELIVLLAAEFLKITILLLQLSPSNQTSGAGKHTTLYYPFLIDFIYDSLILAFIFLVMTTYPGD